MKIGYLTELRRQSKPQPDIWGGKTAGEYTPMGVIKKQTFRKQITPVWPLN